MVENQIDISSIDIQLDKSTENGKTPLIVCIDGQVSGFITAMDTIKPQAKGNVLQLKKMGLEGLENTPGQYLSAGQKRRLSLARLVASHTKLWLLDEPTIALDPASVEALRDLITEHRNKGGMIIIANNVDLKIKDTTELNLNNFATISEGIWEGVG